MNGKRLYPIWLGKAAVLFFILLAVGLPTKSAVAVPPLINYQGALKDASGPVNGTKSMDFTLYEDGERVWTETQKVEIQNGIYNVLLGSVTKLPAALFAGKGAFELEVSVDEGTILAPRQPLTSIPFAFRSASAESAQQAEIAMLALNVADGAVSASAIAPGSISAAQLDPSVVTLDQLQEVCPEGTALFRTTTGWQCRETLSLLPGDELSVACYDGPVGTKDIGICQGGQRLWKADGPGECTGQELPKLEDCSYRDLDCDGLTDECGSQIQSISFPGQESFRFESAMTSNGDTIVVWAQSDGTYQRIYMMEFRNGQWSKPATLADSISPSGSDAGLSSVAMAENGDAVITWQQKVGSFYQVFISERRNGTWHHPQSLSDHVSFDEQNCTRATLAMSDNGNTLMAWMQSSDFATAPASVYVSEYKDGTWNRPASVADRFGPSGMIGPISFHYAPSVAMNDNGDAVVVWIMKNNLGKFALFAGRRVLADSPNWVVPSGVDDYLAEGISSQMINPTAAISATGDAIAGYRDTNIYLIEFSGSAKTWGGPFRANPDVNSGYVSSSLQLAMSDNGDAIAAWTQSGTVPDSHGNSLTTSRAYFAERRQGVWKLPSGLEDFIGKPDDTDAMYIQVLITSGSDQRILWRERDNSPIGGGEIRLFTSMFNGSGWNHPHNYEYRPYINYGPYLTRFLYRRASGSGERNIVYSEEINRHLRVTMHDIRPDEDYDGTLRYLDCNDFDAGVNPSARERCDGIDNDCDQQIDEAPVCTVCSSPAECPSSQPPVCNDPWTCQGTRIDAVCDGHCGEETVDDDSACDASVLASECTPYKPVYCSGEQDQTDPSCATSCTVDTDCADGYFCNAGFCAFKSG